MFFRLGSHEVFTDKAPQYGFFEVDYVKHSEDDLEVWVLGRHVAISRVRDRRKEHEGSGTA